MKSRAQIISILILIAPHVVASQAPGEQPTIPHITYVDPPDPIVAPDPPRPTAPPSPSPPVDAPVQAPQPDPVKTREAREEELSDQIKVMTKQYDDLEIEMLHLTWTTSIRPEGNGRDVPNTEADDLKELRGMDLVGFTKEDKAKINQKIRDLMSKLSEERKQLGHDFVVSIKLNNQIIKAKRELHLLDILDEK